MLEIHEFTDNVQPIDISPDGEYIVGCCYCGWDGEFQDIVKLFQPI